MDELNFWQRNEGQLIGSFGAAVVAILAAFLTYYLAKIQTNKKNKESYRGLLYTLHVELDWHRHHFDLLKKSIEGIENVSIINKEFVLKSPPMQFDLLICEKSVSNLIAYRKFDHEIIALLTSYINQIRNINYFLDFNNANAILSKVENESEKKVHIKNYFSVLRNEYINKTRTVISDIRILIEKELKNYSKNKIANREIK